MIILEFHEMEYENPHKKTNKQKTHPRLFIVTEIKTYHHTVNIIIKSPKKQNKTKRNQLTTPLSTSIRSGKRQPPLGGARQMLSSRMM